VVVGVISRAGLTIMPAVPWEVSPPPVGPDELPNFKFLPRCFDVQVLCRLKRTDD